MSKFKVGDRVLITANTNHSVNKVGEIGVLITEMGRDGEARVQVGGRSSTGNWTRITDMELITEGGEVKTYQRKTYKLIKDTPDLKKGAIFQEKCDAGDQDFVLLDEQYIKYDDEDGDRDETNYLFPRKAVEEQSAWFVEVFKVEPQFITREELDQFEAFKATKIKKASAKTVALAVTKPGKRTWTPAQREAHSARIKAAWAAKKVAK